MRTMAATSASATHTAKMILFMVFRYARMPRVAGDTENGAARIASKARLSYRRSRVPARPVLPVFLNRDRPRRSALGWAAGRAREHLPESRANHDARRVALVGV